MRQRRRSGTGASQRRHRARHQSRGRVWEHVWEHGTEAGMRIPSWRYWKATSDAPVEYSAVLNQLNNFFFHFLLVWLKLKRQIHSSVFSTLWFVCGGVRAREPESTRLRPVQTVKQASTLGGGGGGGGGGFNIDSHTTDMVLLCVTLRRADIFRQRRD